MSHTCTQRIKSSWHFLQCIPAVEFMKLLSACISTCREVSTILLSQGLYATNWELLSYRNLKWFVLLVWAIPSFTEASTGSITPWTLLLITVSVSGSIGCNRRKVLKRSVQRCDRLFLPSASARTNLRTNIYTLHRHQESSFSQGELDYMDYLSDICNTTCYFQLDRNRCCQNHLKS